MAHRNLFHPEGTGSFAKVTVRPFTSGLAPLDFDPVSRSATLVLTDHFRKIFEFDLASRGNDHRALNRVLQFHVPESVVSDQQRLQSVF